MSNKKNEIFCFICGKNFNINEYYLHYIDCKDNFLDENKSNIIIFETPFFIDNLLNELNSNNLDNEKINNINKKFKNIYNNLRKETQSNFLTPQIKQENHLDVNLNNKKRKYTYDKKNNINLFQKQIIKKFNKIRKEDFEHLNTSLKIQNF
jgi:16S rRNA C1402 (ribose-2'-O) methylase RsmI